MMTPWVGWFNSSRSGADALAAWQAQSYVDNFRSLLGIDGAGSGVVCAFHIRRGDKARGEWKVRGGARLIHYLSMAEAMQDDMHHKPR
jgi:hypothetical protein